MKSKLIMILFQWFRYLLDNLLCLIINLFFSSFSAQHQPSSTELVVQPPYGAAASAVMTFDPPVQATIDTAMQAFPETNANLQRILKKLDAPADKL